MTTEGIKSEYLDDSVAEAYDDERFTSVVGRTFDRLEKRALAAIVEQARRGLRADPQVLDIPCGSGRITELLLQSGLRVTGGDISPAMIAVARRKLARFSARASWTVLDLDRLALEDNSIDLATCIRLFHHIESDARAHVMSELARVSRRYVIVNVSFSSPYYRARRRLKQLLGQGISRTAATWTDIHREAGKAGLRLVAHRFVWPLVSEDLILLFEKEGAST